jgi:hypothetical protein
MNHITDLKPLSSQWLFKLNRQVKRKTPAISLFVAPTDVKPISKADISNKESIDAQRNGNAWTLSCSM